MHDSVVLLFQHIEGEQPGCLNFPPEEKEIVEDIAQALDNSGDFKNVEVYQVTTKKVEF